MSFDTELLLALRIGRLVERYKELLGLDKWTVEVCFAEEPLGATVEPAWQYQHAKLTFDLEKVAEESPAELEWTVRHELFHCLVAPLAELACQGLKGEQHRFAEKVEDLVVSQLAAMPMFSQEE